MHDSTKKWVLTKISSLILIPLMMWFVTCFAAIYDKDYLEIVTFFSKQKYQILFSIFIVVGFFFSALTISEIFEDYIGKDKLKNVANKFVYFFSIVIPLFVIICLIRI